MTLLAFIAVQLVPGDPIRIMTHGRTSDAEVEKIYDELGMNRPLIVQYGSFLAGVATGDFGTSIIQKAPVSTLISEKLAPTLGLLGLSAIFAILIALPLTLVAVRYRNRWPDHMIRAGSMVGFAMPPFWIGLLLILGFGLTLKWFPISGFGSTPIAHFHHLVLPSLTIALFLAPILIQSLRNSMLDVLTTDHVEVARAKGLSEWQVLGHHVLRNALIPAITVLAVNISFLVSGAVIVEYVFSIQGLGSLLVRSVGYRDYPIIQGLAVVFALIVVAVNLLADLCYILVDRRVARS
ncbi:MAG: ABC transporter permease [Hyphomicrobiales bacterium]|nr:ABC transporter permease [Hyphomicrobiales bacterium]